jgi:ubiquinone/menaquinone biosynthesis C-methylase UbiE
MNIIEQQEIWGNPNNWINDGEEWSVYFGDTDNLWQQISNKFDKYLKGNVVEIAPGYGRMTKYLLDHNINLHIVDVNKNCISKCVYKFGDNVKSYIVNDGKTLNYSDNQIDFVFSWDSFVHMTEDVIESYIKEIYRILKNGGYSFIHHSFFYSDSLPSHNIAGRSSMNPILFKEIVERNNMIIVSQEDFRVSDNITDTISIFKKI